jgi:hypothetical protein
MSLWSNVAAVVTPAGNLYCLVSYSISWRRRVENGLLGGSINLESTERGLVMSG